MRSIVIISLLAFGLSCSKTNDPVPLKGSAIFGTWQMVNSGVTITIEIPKQDQDTTLLSNIQLHTQLIGYSKLNASVTYSGKTKTTNSGSGPNYIEWDKNGDYFNFYFWVESPTTLSSTNNQLVGLHPNNDFSEMTSTLVGPNLTEPFFGTPYANPQTDVCWVAIGGYDGTNKNNAKVVYPQAPIIFKRIKGPQ